MAKKFGNEGNTRATETGGNYDKVGPTIVIGVAFDPEHSPAQAHPTATAIRR